MKTNGVPHSVLDITPAQALQMGLTHEGWHCGIAVYAAYDGDPEDVHAAIEVIARKPWLDWWLDVGGMWTQFVNLFRPHDPLLFAFVLRPIKVNAPA